MSTKAFQDAGDVQCGAVVMMMGHPCKVVESVLEASDTVSITGVSLINKEQHQVRCTKALRLTVPSVEYQDYTVLGADVCLGFVSLQSTDGSSRTDLKLPTFSRTPNDHDKAVAQQLLEKLSGLSPGERLLATVVKACGMEKIIEVRTVVDV